MRVLLFNKPFRVLSQFTDAAGRSTLGDYIRDREVYPAGRLDYDSEGLLVLTDDGRLQARLTDPRYKVRKVYYAQVEGELTEQALAALAQQGVELRDGPARALGAERVAGPPRLWERHPPIRYRKSIPTSWLRLTIDEGRNRQVRRMTAAVGHPTLRLIRWSVGEWELGRLAPGELREVKAG